MLNITQKSVNVLAKNKVEYLQLILWSWVRDIKITIIASDITLPLINTLKKIFFLNKSLKELSVEYNVSFDGHKGLFYEVDKEAIDLAKKFYNNQEIKNKSYLTTYYNKILNTNKFEAFIKKEILSDIFTLLRSLHLIRLSGLDKKKIILVKDPINKFVIEYMGNKYNVKYQIKWITPSTLYPAIYYCQLFIELLRRGIVINKKRKEYKLSKEAAWGFYRKTLRDDILIDNIKFSPRDLLILDFNSNDYHRKSAFKEAQKRDFSTISVGNLKININKNILNLLFFYFLVPIKWYFLLFLKKQSYLFYYVTLFHKRCFPIEVLMNLYRIKCHVSVVDNGDIALTIILNKYGAKNVIFHWSDLTVFKAHEYIFLSHNIYFMWGDIHYDYHSDNFYVDSKINIGCIFKEEYNKALKNKEVIIAQLNHYKRKRRIVTFFDTSFNNSTLPFTENLFLEYLKMIKEFCNIRKDVFVLLKPKNETNYWDRLNAVNRHQFNNIWSGLMACENFCYLDPTRWSIEEIIAVSDVCVNWGMNSPATIALICGKNALYFDSTGNIHHPFAKKYKNIIVFEDKDLLFNQIENILNDKFMCHNVIGEKEIREYDAFSDDNAIERLRDNLYELTLKTG